MTNKELAELLNLPYVGSSDSICGHEGRYFRNPVRNLGEAIKLADFLSTEHRWDISIELRHGTTLVLANPLLAFPVAIKHTKNTDTCSAIVDAIAIACESARTRSNRLPSETD